MWLMTYQHNFKYLSEEAEIVRFVKKQSSTKRRQKKLFNYKDK